MVKTESDGKTFKANFTVIPKLRENNIYTFTLLIL